MSRRWPRPHYLSGRRRRSSRRLPKFRPRPPTDTAGPTRLPGRADVVPSGKREARVPSSGIRWRSNDGSRMMARTVEVAVPPCATRQRTRLPHGRQSGARAPSLHLARAAALPVGAPLIDRVSAHRTRHPGQARASVDSQVTGDLLAGKLIGDFSTALAESHLYRLQAPDRMARSNRGASRAWLFVPLPPIRLKAEGSLP